MLCCTTAGAAEHPRAGRAEQSKAGANCRQLLGDVTFRDYSRQGRKAVCRLDDPE